MVDVSPNSGSGPEHEPPKRSPNFGDLFWLGTGCATCVVGGGAIGYALDTVLHTTPWITFGGLAFGVVSAVLLAVAQVRKFL
jgi:F0F1-type ATP synthase assembly protein I